METRLSRLRRMEQEQRDFSRAMYGHAPCNAAWAARRADDERRRAIRDWYRKAENRLRYLENRLLDFEKQKRQHVAETPRPPKADEARPVDETPPADEPLVIRRRGEGGPHAK